ncbi:hypothetical protein H4R34_001339 [Dimargaris verticillata]|uniref:15-cis-phytoene synthase n=1 Tax=Dimargaris verticillata TaxID=2761393 RepID=A0A9W8EEK8_9FUNG|nr:hypothetical protein H4R34_001339 [Dimargaris verticillata]
MSKVMYRPWQGIPSPHLCRPGQALLSRWAAVRTLASTQRLGFGTPSAVDYCRHMVQKHDRNQYLASVFFPAALRPAVWGLAAFNLELAMIRDTVSDESIGLMRLLFWKQFLDNLTKHPVTLVLNDAIHELKLSVSWLRKLITARETNLTHPTYHRLDDIETYAELTASSLLYLQLEMLGIRDVKADHLASHLGKAIGIATILRATPFHAKKRLLYLPLESLAKHKVSQENVFRYGRTEGLSDVVFEVATRAHDHLLTAQQHLTDAPPQALRALLLTVPIWHYLKRLERYHFDVFDPRLQTTDWRMPFYMWRASRTQTLFKL